MAARNKKLLGAGILGAGALGLGAYALGRRHAQPAETQAKVSGVLYAAMADELAAIQQEKVAINLAPVGAFFGNMASRAATAAPKAMGFLENLGAKALGGATNLATRHGGQVGQRVAGGLMNAGQHVGGVQNLNRLAGAGIAGAGVLGTGMLANRMLRRPQQTTVNVQR